MEEQSASSVIVSFKDTCPCSIAPPYKCVEMAVLLPNPLTLIVLLGLQKLALPSIAEYSIHIIET